MKIAGYLKTSLIEWPGKITSVIFTSGCNFRCPFCHNADLVEERGITLIPEEKILSDLKERKKWIDAVVVTGGEPTLQKDLPIFLKNLKDMEFLSMIHTNGTMPKMIADLLSRHLVDYLSMDIKGNFDNYPNFSNVESSLEKIKESIKLIADSGVEYELRTTVVPDLHSKESLVKLASELKGLVKDCRWFLQQFRPMNTLDKSFMKIKPFSKEEMITFQKELQKIVPQTLLRGV